MGKRIGNSLLGIPVAFWGAIFVLVIIQGMWDFIVGDRTIFRTTLVVLSTLGLGSLIILSLISKRTLMNILNGQMGTR